MSRYALEHDRMFSHFGVNALYCSLRYNFNVGNIFDIKFYVGKLARSHCLSNRLSTSVAGVNVLRDMIFFRAAKD